jgi:KDO2-lipid IV(A) lauroyltransferase
VILRHHVEYLSLAGLATVMRALPRPIALELGAAVGELGWLLRLRRATVLANLRTALPELAEARRRAVAARSSRNFGRTTTEFVRFAGRDRRRLGDIVTLNGQEALRAALAPDRGAVVVTAHLGSWALYVTALAAAGIPCALLVGRQHNPMVDDFILAIPGDAVHFISKGATAPRETIRCLRKGWAVIIVADQDAGPHGDMVPLLGRTASTLALPGAVVARHGWPLFIMAGHRVTRGTHHVDISPIELPGAEADHAHRVVISARINDALGQAILEHPDQYFWHHRRWREYP